MNGTGMLSSTVVWFLYPNDQVNHSYSNMRVSWIYITVFSVGLLEILWWYLRDNWFKWDCEIDINNDQWDSISLMIALKYVVCVAFQWLVFVIQEWMMYLFYFLNLNTYTTTPITAADPMIPDTIATDSMGDSPGFEIFLRSYVMFTLFPLVTVILS